jgi:hypothetical protein
MKPARNRGAAVVVAIWCAATVAACGAASSGSPSTGGGSSGSLLEYSECVRAHGVPGFPDPSTTQGPNAMGIDGYNFNLPANLNLQSPAYVNASKECGHLIGSGNGTPHSLPAKARQAALAHAECMRRNGVPNFPDPIVRASGGGISVTSGGSGLDPRAPAFQHAQKVCQPGAP